MAQLPFLAVGRVEDSTTLASFCPDTIEQAQQRDTEDVFRKLLTAAGKKLRHGEKTRLQWNDGSVCCLMDNNKVLLYCVVTSDLQYPERLAYGMLVELMKIVDKSGRDSNVDVITIPENALTQHIRSDMQALLEKYEDSKQWQSLMEALNKVSSATNTMKDNMNAAGANQDGIKNMQANANQMNASGQMFAQEGRDLDDRYRSKNRLMGAGVVVLIVVVALFFIFRGGGSTTTDPPSAVVTTTVPTVTIPVPSAADDAEPAASDDGADGDGSVPAPSPADDAAPAAGDDSDGGGDGTVIV